MTIPATTDHERRPAAGAAPPYVAVAACCALTATIACHRTPDVEPGNVPEEPGRVVVADAGGSVNAGGAEARAGAPNEPAMTVRSWFALGSGCRALPDRPRDVDLEIGRDAGDPRRYWLRFRMPRYRLDGDRPVAPGAATFARECGLRVGVYPGADLKLRTVAADVPYLVRKDAGAEVRLRSRLFVGNTDLEQRVTRVDAAAAVDRGYRTHLRASAPAQRALDSLRCEQPKIVGLDISAATFRDDTSPGVLVELDGHLATVVVELEACAHDRTAPSHHERSSRGANTKESES